MKQVFRSFQFVLFFGLTVHFSAQAGEEIKTVKISSPDKKSFLKADKEMIENINQDIREWSSIKIAVIHHSSSDQDIHRSFGL